MWAPLVVYSVMSSSRPVTPPDPDLVRRSLPQGQVGARSRDVGQGQGEARPVAGQGHEPTTEPLARRRGLMEDLGLAVLTARTRRDLGLTAGDASLRRTWGSQSAAKPAAEVRLAVPLAACFAEDLQSIRSPSCRCRAEGWSGLEGESELNCSLSLPSTGELIPSGIARRGR
jgi:hypothetical protein